jgi:hypothetical protein
MHPEIQFPNRDFKTFMLLIKECLEFLTPSIINSPKIINTLQDLRWYIIFNFTWYNVLTNALIGLEKNNASRVHAFFNTEDFQSWAIYNNDVETPPARSCVTVKLL